MLNQQGEILFTGLQRKELIEWIRITCIVITTEPLGYDLTKRVGDFLLRV